MATTKMNVLDLGDSDVRRRIATRLHARTRSRAARAGFAFELDTVFIEACLLEQEGRCAVSGVAFSMQDFPDALVRHPFAPSVDRILSKGGYTRDNVRIVCVATNFGLGQWGDEVFLVIARGVVAQAEPKVVAHTASPMSSLEERIAAAEAVLPTLTEVERRRQLRRIAGLRRALTLGPDGLAEAARRAVATRRRRLATADGT